MFENIGGKIKTWAKICTIIGFVLSVIITMICWANELKFGLGVIILIVGCFISWISNLTLYGFGELIETNAQIAQNTYSLMRITTSQSSILQGISKTQQKYMLPKNIVSHTQKNFLPDNIDTRPEDIRNPLSLDELEKEKLYGYALQMYGNRSYEVAYNTLLKIKGYKNTDQLLSELADKI